MEDDLIKFLKKISFEIKKLKIEHYHCGDDFYSCSKLDLYNHVVEKNECNCGADEHNGKVDLLLKTIDLSIKIIESKSMRFNNLIPIDLCDRVLMPGDDKSTVCKTCWGTGNCHEGKTEEEFEALKKLYGQSQ